MFHWLPPIHYPTRSAPVTSSNDSSHVQRIYHLESYRQWQSETRSHFVLTSALTECMLIPQKHWRQFACWLLDVAGWIVTFVKTCSLPCCLYNQCTPLFFDCFSSARQSFPFLDFKFITKKHILVGFISLSTLVSRLSLLCILFTLYACQKKIIVGLKPLTNFICDQQCFCFEI